jgi:AraC-like DNA-binding protein
LSDVAEAVGYSPAYLTNLLQTETGLTVKRWIIERRMAQARVTAQTTQSVRQIAEQAGYGDPGYFTRQFRQLPWCFSSSMANWRQSSVALN